MIDRSKIIVMSKMAVYDKYNGEKDRRINEYFRHDYVYRKNMWTRLCATIGALILYAFYWLRKIVLEGVDIFSLDLKQVGRDGAFFLLAILVFYTLVGTFLASREYDAAQKRLRRYFTYVKQLERQKSMAKPPKEASNLYYGADIVDKRNHSRLL